MHRKAVLLLSVTVLLAVNFTACSRPRARLATQTAQPASAATPQSDLPTLQPSATLLPSSTPFPTATPLVINQPLPDDLQSDLDEIDALLEDLLREVSAGGNGITVP